MSAQKAVKKNEEKSYDEVPYESFCYPQTHPHHLNTMATLFKLKTPNFKEARILEIGCASGGNLTPIAVAYPKAKLVGIDISSEQIEQANKRKEALGLKNVEFKQEDVLNLKASSKKDQFDYIICHGVFSWVPENVRKKIFEVCNDMLSPNGVAVISYNALPGWNAVRSLRDMMLYHSNRFENPNDKVAQSRLLLNFLSENVPEGNVAYKSVIESEINLLQKVNNSYLYHDHLESENTQFYLNDFVAMARESGLDYVGDTNIASMYLGNMPPKVMEVLKAIDDVVAQEQYMDFITNRRFRSSILCKQGAVINRNIDKEQIMDYYLNFNPAVQVIGFDTSKDITFRVGAAEFKTHEPVASTLFMELAANGIKPISAKDLVERTRVKLGVEKTDAIEKALIESGLQLMLMGYINIYSDSPEYVSTLSEKPVANPIARFEAQSNLALSLTNSFGTAVATDITANILVRNLDGTKTKEDLFAVLVEAIEDGTLKLNRDGNPIEDKKERDLLLTQILDTVLNKLAENAFLIG